MSEPSRVELFLTQEMGVANLAAVREQLAGTWIVLALAPDLAAERSGQLALLVAADILCRLGPYCPSLAVAVTPDVCVAPGVPLLKPGAPLATELVRYMGLVQRPHERTGRGYQVGAPSDVGDLLLAVGEVDVPARRVVYAWYEGWTGGFGDRPRRSTYRGPNPFGALLAGALGALAVSRHLLAPIAGPALSPQDLPPAAALSAYSYSWPEHPSREPELPEVVDLRPAEPILLVGAGAVASGLALALAALPRAMGTIAVVDDDCLDATNLERHLVSTWADVGSAKAARLASLFANGAANGLRWLPHLCSYEQLAPAAWRTAITTVDSAAARRRVQFDLPYVLLNAGTVGSEFLVSRHDYGEGSCAECLYPERSQIVHSTGELLASQVGLEFAEVADLLASGTPLDAEQVERVVWRGKLVFPPEALARARIEGIRALAVVACTTAQVRSNLPAATIGFVAALPGLLLASELVKEITLRNPGEARPPLVADRNVFRLDTFGFLVTELELSRPSRNCRCRQTAMRSAYDRRWGRRGY